MNKVLLALIAGAAVLTGCNNAVMGERKYVPATGEQGAVKPMDGVQVEEYKPVPAAKVAPTQLAANEDKVAPVAPAPVEDFQDVPVKQAAPAQNVQAIPVQQKTQNQVAPVQGTTKSQAAGQTKFAPMTEKFSNEGITSTGKTSKKSAVRTKSSVYVVKRGDTLGKIAKKHGVKLADLCQANKIAKGQEGKIRVGRKLTIPATTAKKATTANKAKAGKKATTAQKGEYIVRKGDTPDGIARRHRVKLADLLDANNLTESSSRRLRIGQKLVIPGRKATVKKETRAKKDSVVKPVAKVEDKEDVKPNQDKDILESTDSTTKVADKEQETKVETTTAKATATEKKPQEKVEVDDDSDIISVTEEISIEDFAKKYGVSVEKIRSMNEEHANADKIPAGAVVFIPKK